MVLTVHDIKIRFIGTKEFVEGTKDTEPTVQEIRTLMKFSGYTVRNIKIDYDDFQGFYRFSGRIYPYLTRRECEYHICDNQCELSEVITGKYKKSWNCNFKGLNRRYTCQLYKPTGPHICLKCGSGICHCDE